MTKTVIQKKFFILENDLALQKNEFTGIRRRFYFKKYQNNNELNV